VQKRLQAKHAKLTVFSLPILCCSQSRDGPNLAMYNIWKLPKKNSMYLVTHWNLSEKWWFGIFGIWWIWVSFSMNAPRIRVCFSIFPIRELLNSSPLPPNGKIGWIYCRIAHFPKIFLKVLSKIDQNFWGKKKSLFCMGRNHILFRLDFDENSWVEKSLPNELVCIFTKHFASCCKSQCPHLRSSSVTMYN
jgi:hypothetical protein